MTSPYPEQFLIAFKGALVEAARELGTPIGPDNNGTPIGPDNNGFLARLVSVFIEEFYATSITGAAISVVDVPVGVKKSAA